MRKFFYSSAMALRDSIRAARLRLTGKADPEADDDLVSAVRTNGEKYEVDATMVECAVKDANLVSSEAADGSGLHYPVIDIDVPCQWVPSATPGHGHLYVDRAITWDQYQDILRSLAEAGIVERMFRVRSIEQGSTMVRVPWKKKPVAA